MRISHGNTKRAFVYGVRAGTTPVKRVMLGTRQIWPDTSARVATMALDMSPLEGTVEGAYWQHALDAVQTGSSETCYISVRAGGREYRMQTTYGAWNRAAYHAGVVDFLGDGPVREALRVGDEVTVTLVVPEMRTATIGGEQAGYEGKQEANYANGAYVTGVFPAALPGTAVWGTFRKGQKRVSTGMRIMVSAGGDVLMDIHRQQDGHGRGMHNWKWGGIGYTDGAVTLTVIPHQARGEWGAYLVYPAFKRELKLTVTTLHTYDGLHWEGL